MPHRLLEHTTQGYPPLQSREARTGGTVVVAIDRQGNPYPASVRLDKRVGPAAAPAGEPGGGRVPHADAQAGGRELAHLRTIYLRVEDERLDSLAEQRSVKQRLGSPPVAAKRCQEYWFACSDADPRAIGIYRRHYSANLKRNHHAGIGGPGERMVLLTQDCSALWVWRRRPE